MGKKGRILLVEDDDQVRVLMEHVLVLAGYAVDGVPSVASAINHLETRPYDLLVADDRLPDGRGVRLADIGKERGIHTLVLTGYMLLSDNKDLDQHQHVMKPVRAEQLVELVKQRLSEPRPRPFKSVLDAP